MTATAASAPLKNPKREAGGGSWRVGASASVCTDIDFLLYVVCSLVWT